MEDGSVYQTGTIALGVENISIFKQNHPKLDPKVQKHASARVIRHENFTWVIITLKSWLITVICSGENKNQRTIGMPNLNEISAKQIL